MSRSTESDNYKTRIAGTMRITFAASCIAALVAGISLASTSAGIETTESNMIRFCHAIESGEQDSVMYDELTMGKPGVTKHHIQHALDIIPPFEAMSGGGMGGGGTPAFEGLNWDSEGQAIWSNGCMSPSPSESPSPPPPPAEVASPVEESTPIDSATEEITQTPIVAETPIPISEPELGQGEAIQATPEAVAAQPELGQTPTSIPAGGGGEFAPGETNNRTWFAVLILSLLAAAGSGLRLMFAKN